MKHDWWGFAAAFPHKCVVQYNPFNTAVLFVQIAFEDERLKAPS
jgi:hypothetical protein